MEALLSKIPTAELTKLVNRLEAATSRLEDMAEKTVEPGSTVSAPIVAAPTISSQPPAPSAPKVEIPEIIQDYNEFIATTVKKFVNLSDELGGLVAQEVGYYHIKS